MRTWIVCGYSAHLGWRSVSSRPLIHSRTRFESASRPEWIAVGGDWTPPALRHGPEARVIESRVPRPRV